MSQRIFGEAAGLSIGAVLAALAAVRRGKAVHPHGVVYEAELAIAGDSTAPQAAELLARRGEHHAIARFSRSIGLPRPITDLLGLSLRVPDAYGSGMHQDFLLVTSADYPVVHHIFLPARDVQQRPYTSSLPYRAKDDLFLVGALPKPSSPRVGRGNELERLDAAASTGRLAFDIAVASIMGRFRPVGSLRIGRRLPHAMDALRFNPWNTGGGMAPAGWLNDARDRAYKLSQGAWRRTRRDGAALQDAADRTLEQRELRARDHRAVSITFRRGTEADARAAADLWLGARRVAIGTIPKPVHDDEDVRAWFTSHVVRDTELWVAEDRAGALVGILVLDGEWLDQLYIEPTVTGRGIGTRLVNLAKRERPEGLQLWTFASNTGAQRFYQRHGFVETRRTDGRDNEEGAPDILYTWPGEGAGG